MEGDISSGHSEGKSGSPPLSVTLRSKSQRVKDSRGGSMSGYQMIVGKTKGIVGIVGKTKGEIKRVIVESEWG